MHSQRNLSLEWIKLGAAVLVVFIHVTLPGTAGRVMNCLARCGVPLFFAISGYYAWGAGAEKLLRRLKHSLGLMLGANLLYLIWGAWEHTAQGGDLLRYLKGKFSAGNMARLLLTGDSPFAVHLWFLSALVFCYLVLWLYVRFFQEQTPRYAPLYAAGAGLLGAAICFDSYFDFHTLGEMKLVSAAFRNGLYLGLPLFLMGMFLHQYRPRLLSAYRWSPRRSVALIVLGFALSLLQWFGAGKANLPLGMLLVVPELLLLSNAWAAMEGAPALMRRLAPFAGRVSTVIYIIHVLFIRAIKLYEDRSPFFSYLYRGEDHIPFALWVAILSLLTGILWCAVRGARRAQ